MEPLTQSVNVPTTETRRVSTSSTTPPMMAATINSQRGLAKGVSDRRSNVRTPGAGHYPACSPVSTGSTTYFDAVSTTHSSNAVKSGRSLTAKATPIAVTIDELMTYPVDGQRRVITITAMIPVTRRTHVKDAEGFESVKNVTTTEETSMTLCADNVRFAVCMALKTPTTGLCDNPKKCGCAHFDGRKYGTNLCGCSIGTGSCRCNGRFIHVKETVAAATAPDASSVSRVHGATRRPVAAPAPIVRKMMCWMHLAYELGISTSKCTHPRCTYAHDEIDQVEKDYIAEFRSRLAAGTLITQAVVDEVVKVLMTNEVYRAEILDLSGGSWPELSRGALSSWFRLWFRAVSKFRTEEDPDALALFGKANGIEENMVWEIARRFQSCTASFAMAEKRVFGASTSRIICPTGKKHDDQVVLCQGGKSCNHGAHYPVCLNADKTPNPAVAAVLEQIDLDNFNGIDSYPTRVDRADLLRQYRVKEAEFARADAAAKEERIGAGERITREASRRALREQLGSIRSKYLNSYAKLQVIPADTVLVVRAPVIKAVETPVASVDLKDTTIFKKLPELTEEERLARAKEAEIVRAFAVAKADERRKLKAASDAVLAAKEEMEREAREDAKFMMESAIADYVKDTNDNVLLSILFTEHTYELIQVSGDTRRITTTHTIEGKPIIYEVIDGEGNTHQMMRVRGELDLVSAFRYKMVAFTEATKDLTVEMAQEYTTSGAIDNISFWAYIKNPLVREAWAQFKATGTGSWTQFYARVTSKYEEWTNMGITRHVVRAARNRRGGKRSKYDEDDQNDEIIEYVDENCSIKKQYANFWAYFNKLPKTAIGAGFVMSTWASELATAEPALFGEYLERKLVIKFDNWIQDDAVRAAIKVVYDAHDCTWDQARMFSTVITVRAPEIDFDEFVAHVDDTISYCFSPASKNIGSVGGGVAWSVFKTNPDEYLHFYQNQSSIDETLESYKAKRAQGWSTVRYGTAVRTVLNSLAYIPASELKAVAKKMASTCGIIAKLDSVAKMVSYIHENGQHPLGQKFVFIHKSKSYEVATSLWDGILYKLFLELGSVELNEDNIRALRKQLPVSDAAAAAQRDEAASVELASLQQAALKKNTADICGVKGKRRARDEMEARLTKERAELEASFDAKKVMVQQSATNIWTSDAESGLTPVVELVEKACAGEKITVVAEETTKLVKVATKKPVKSTVPANTFAVLADKKQESSAFDPFNFSNPLAEMERALDAQYEVKKPAHSHYIKVDRVAIEERELSYRAIIIGPFETKQAATPLFSLLRTQLQGGACISKKSAKLFEVHIYLTRPDGKKANENCTRLENNDDNCMTELIADIAKTISIKPSAFKTTFELPADEEDDDDTASTCSTDSDDSDDSASTCSTDSDDSDSSTDSEDSDDSEDEFVIPGCEVNRSFAKAGQMPGGLELDSFDTIVSTKPGARGNGKTVRRETISDERKDRGMRKKGACGAKNTRGDNVCRDTRGDDDHRRGGRDDDE
jgi:hypothetical protein